MTNTKRETAHQIWCDRIQSELNWILYPKNVRNGKSAFMTTRESIKTRADQAIKAVIDFETLRLRIIVDELILKLDASKKALDEVKALKVKWYEFGMQLEKKKMIAANTATLEAYQAAVLVMVNTKPPSKVEPK